MSHIVIIGNGVAGITAARNIRKQSDHRITVISDESDHFYSRPALMYVFMGHMKYEHTKPYEDWFWMKNRIDLMRDRATFINTSAKIVELASGNTCTYDYLVLATGARSLMAGWPGQDLEGVQGFTNLNDLALLESNARGIRRAVIVGGGLIGIEVAEMLRSRDIETTMLVREGTYCNHLLPAEEASMVHAQLRAHNVDVHFNTVLSEIVGDDERRVRRVVAQQMNIDCQLVVLTAGVVPRTDIAKDSGIATDRGILVDEFFATSASDVFAVGDCAQRPDGRVDLFWYTARSHGECVASTLCGERKPYDPGVYYNSAKFFDLEYQIYGFVPSITESTSAPAHTSRLSTDNVQSWTMSVRGERGFLRITHRNNAVLGFSAMGMRLRSDVCTQWIREGASLERVLKHLRACQFDEEFTQHLHVA